MTRRSIRMKWSPLRKRHLLFTGIHMSLMLAAMVPSLVDHDYPTPWWLIKLTLVGLYMVGIPLLRRLGTQVLAENAARLTLLNQPAG
jgi:hypothetical protein